MPSRRPRNAVGMGTPEYERNDAVTLVASAGVPQPERPESARRGLASRNGRYGLRRAPEQPPADPAGQASSKGSRDDASAPLADAQEHPDSDTGELRLFNPHKADKDVEVGEYYLRRKNYAAAESRYREALEFQYNNAPAMYGLAESLEKQKKNDEAVEFYTKYLATLPHGPEADNCKAALQRLGAPVPAGTGTIAQADTKDAKPLRDRPPRTSSVCVGLLCKQSPAPPTTDHPPQ